MAARVTRSRRVRVEAGETAIAPRVDDPRGFAIQNRSGRAVTVSFTYDADNHLQYVVVEAPRPSRSLGGESHPPPTA